MSCPTTPVKRRVYAEAPDGDATKFLGGDGAYHSFPAPAGVTILRVFAQLNNADILTLPTVPFPIIAAPAAGFRHRVLAMQWESSTDSGAYGNVSGPYATIQLENGTGYWYAEPWANDDTATPVITQVDRILGGNSVMADIPIPFTFSRNGWVLSTEFGGQAQFDAQPIMLAMDNNGAGNLTGGHVNNYIRVNLLYLANEPTFS